MSRKVIIESLLGLLTLAGVIVLAVLLTLVNSPAGHAQIKSVNAYDPTNGAPLLAGPGVTITPNNAQAPSAYTLNISPLNAPLDGGGNKGIGFAPGTAYGELETILETDPWQIYTGPGALYGSATATATCTTNGCNSLTVNRVGAQLPGNAALYGVVFTRGTLPGTVSWCDMIINGACSTAWRQVGTTIMGVQNGDNVTVSLFAKAQMKDEYTSYTVTFGNSLVAATNAIYGATIFQVKNVLGSLDSTGQQSYVDCFQPIVGLGASITIPPCQNRYPNELQIVAAIQGGSGSLTAPTGFTAIGALTNNWGIAYSNSLGNRPLPAVPVSGANSSNDMVGISFGIPSSTTYAGATVVDGADGVYLNKTQLSNGPTLQGGTQFRGAVRYSALGVTPAPVAATTGTNNAGGSHNYYAMCVDQFGDQAVVSSATNVTTNSTLGAQNTVVITATLQPGCVDGYILKDSTSTGTNALCTPFSTSAAPTQPMISNNGVVTISCTDTGQTLKSYTAPPYDQTSGQFALPSTIPVDTGQLAALPSTSAIYNITKMVASGVIQNAAMSFGGATDTLSCATQPVWVLCDGGTSATFGAACASGTVLATVTWTGSSVNTKFDATINSSAAIAGHYLGWQLSTGTCATINGGFSGSANIQ